jgi:hypothetical protein
MIIQHAIELNITRLYHYQPFCSAWISQIIFDRKIHFSSPTNFNDPWDCRPYFRIPSEDDLQGFERCIEWLDAAVRQQTSNLDEQDHAQKILQLRNDRRLFERQIRDLSKSIGKALNEIYRIYCLSTKPDSTLMWSHYSRNHQGVCLEFACDNVEFGQAFEVQYSNEYPSLDFAIDAKQPIGLLPLLVKSDVWSYEDEYRVIAQEKIQGPDNTDILRTRKNFLKFPPDALKAVIMGCMISQSDATELRRIIDRQSPPHVALKRAVRSPDRYSLSVLMC